MKKHLFLIVIFISFSVYPQWNANHFSLEAKWGFSLPLFPTNTIDITDYTIPRHLDIGARYMFNKNWGIKFYYAFDRFQDGFLSGVGNSYHRVSIEGVLNISKKFDFLNYRKFNVLVHAGAGITHAFPEAIQRFKNGGRFTFGETPNTPLEFERIGNLMAGFTTQYKLSDRFTFITDSSFVFSREKQYLFNGELINRDRRKVRGGFLNFTIGLQYYIGRNTHHLDWR